MLTPNSEPKTWIVYVGNHAYKYIYFHATTLNVKPTVDLVRESPWERYEYPFIPIGQEAHRPRKRFKVRLETKNDVKLAREQGLPLLLIQPEDLKILHYPLTMPPTVVLPREYRDVIETKFRVHTFQALRALEKPRIEDMVVFLLSYDLIAARAVIERSRDLIDFGYLRKRIFQEDLEEEASKIHLQDFMDLPVIGTQLPKAALVRATQRNRVSEILP